MMEDKLVETEPKPRVLGKGPPCVCNDLPIAIKAAAIKKARMYALRGSSPGPLPTANTSILGKILSLHKACTNKLKQQCVSRG